MPSPRRHLRDNHLWQDMGLPSRAVLSQLMTENLPRLAALSCADMKWKGFIPIANSANAPG